MKIIEGKYNSAKVFTDVVEETAIKQIETLCNQEFVNGSNLRIMPDVHAGAGCTIGFTMNITDKICPNLVGVDIGCGMRTIDLGYVDIDFKELDDIIKNQIPNGRNVHNEIIHSFDLFQLKCYRELRNSERLEKSIGTLGGGNHFIEIDKDENNNKYLVIHSGSRKIGHEIARQYMIKSSSSKKDYEKTFPLKANSKLGKEYLNALDFCLKFALLNRMEMSYQVIEILEEILNQKIKTKFWANKNHNHAIYEKGFYIHRKGATPAKKFEKGIIPGNMRAGTYLVKGKGNPEFLNSSSHGAGRLMSRIQARQKISMKDFKDSMKGIKSNLNSKILDEAPMAYKDIEKVMQAQKKSVKIIKHLKPIINWKG